MENITKLELINQTIVIAALFDNILAGRISFKFISKILQQLLTIDSEP